MLKKLVFPLFLIAIVFLSVNYIKPLVVSVLDKQKEKDEKLSELEAVEATVRNIGTLSESRQSLLESGNGKMAYDYLPVTQDHDHVLDIFNYLAVQSGAVVNDVSFEISKNNPTVSVTNELVDKATGASVPKVSLPEPSAFVASVRFQGSYDGIKSFLGKISGAGRFHAIKSFTIEKQQKKEGEEGGSDDTLLASLGAEFSYLPEKTYPQAHTMPIFANGKFTLNPLDKLVALGEGVPALAEPAVSPRSNPFKP